MLDDPYDLHGSAAFERGALMPQSRGSMMVARAVDPQPGERVLDLCAAPGSEDHPPRRADGRRGRGRGGRARSAARGGPARATRRASAPAACAWSSGTRRGPTTAAATTACWSTRRARTSGRSSPAPTRAGARPRSRSRSCARCSDGSSTPGAAAVRPGGQARVLDLHDQRPPRTSARWRSSCERHPEFGLTKRPADSFRLFRTATARTGSSSLPSSDMDDVDRAAGQPPDTSGDPCSTRTAAARAAASRGCARPSSRAATAASTA